MSRVDGRFFCAKATIASARSVAVSFVPAGIAARSSFVTMPVPHATSSTRFAPFGRRLAMSRA